jgi:hypothetical protein
MSITDLQSVESRQQAFCRPGGAGTEPRTYVESAPLDVIEYFVDPVVGDDTVPFGAAPNMRHRHRFRTLTRALREVPYVMLGAAGPPLPNAFVITLTKDTDYWYETERLSPEPPLGPPDAPPQRGVQWWPDRHR